MSKTYDVAVVGANSLVGEAILAQLAERKFPLGKIYALDTESGTDEDEEDVDFGRRSLSIGDVSEFDFSSVQFAFFAADATISRDYASKAATLGCKVIDNTALFRLEQGVPLVIPEVNPEAIQAAKRSIIATPNPSSVQILIALNVLHEVAQIKRINVVTYQSVSSTGRQAVEELARETIALLNGRPTKPRVYPKQIAFNVLPQVDELLTNGYTREEMSLVWEMRKVLDKPDLLINPSTAQVPVFFGHTNVLHVAFNEAIHANTARELLKKAPSVVVVDKQENDVYATPVTDAVGQDAIFISRVHDDISTQNGLNLWIVGDNVRRAALNSVQIAELWIKH